MNNIDIEELKTKYRKDEVKKNRSALYALRSQFQKKFTPKKILTMSIDEYTQGEGKDDTFCYWVERKLGKLGLISGSTSKMFGAYFSSKDNKFWFAKKYGNDIESAFNEIKKEIIELIDAGKHDNLEKIVKSKIPAMFKGKILSLYYPDKYLNVFSPEHLKHFLSVLNLNNEDLLKQDPVYQRKALVDYKNNDNEMKNWTIDIFGHFLYEFFRPEKQRSAPRLSNRIKDVVLSDDAILSDKNFQSQEDYELVTLEYNIASKKYGKKKITLRQKPNYEMNSRKNRIIGEKGEKIVIIAEVRRVMKEYSYDEDLAKKSVKQVSKESDTYGYDILTKTSGGTRYIEVKTTTAKEGDMSFFFTRNELSAAKKYKNDYYLYIVYEIKKLPKIWIINNPFIGKNALKLVPIKYKVEIRTK